MDSNINIDDEEVSPASRPNNPHGIFLDFRFQPPLLFGETTGLTISEDGLTGYNHGVGWRTLLGDNTINFENNPGKYYFDIKINTVSSSWGNSIGVADKAYNNSSTTILGYKEYGGAKSWGWFSYNSGLEGFLHDGVTYGEKPNKYNDGDVIRVVIETADKSISFYKNDVLVGDKPFVDIDSNEVISAFTPCGDADSVTILK